MAIYDKDDLCWLVGVIHGIGYELKRSYKVRTSSESLKNTIIEVLTRLSIEYLVDKSTKNYHHIFIQVDKDSLLCAKLDTCWLTGLLDSKAKFRYSSTTDKRDYHLEVTSKNLGTISNMRNLLDSAGIRGVVSTTKAGLYRFRVHKKSYIKSLALKSMFRDPEQLSKLEALSSTIT